MAERRSEPDLFILEGVFRAYAARKVHPRMPLRPLLEQVWPDEKLRPSRTKIYRYWQDRARKEQSTVVITMFRVLLERREELRGVRHDAKAMEDEVFLRLERELVATEAPDSHGLLRSIDRLDTESAKRQETLAKRQEKLSEMLGEAQELKAAGDGTAEVVLSGLLRHAASSGMVGSAPVREALLLLLRERLAAQGANRRRRLGEPRQLVHALYAEDTPDGGVMDVAIGLLRHHLQQDGLLDTALSATIADLESAGATKSVAELHPEAAMILLELDRVDDAFAALSEVDLNDVDRGTLFRVDRGTLFRLAARFGRAMYVHPELPQEMWPDLHKAAVRALPGDGEEEVGAREVGWLKSCRDSLGDEALPDGLDRYWVKALVEKPVGTPVEDQPAPMGDQPEEVSIGPWSAIETAEVVVHRLQELNRYEHAREVARDVLEHCADETPLTVAERRTLDRFRALVTPASAASDEFDKAVDHLYQALAERTGPVRNLTRERLRLIAELLPET